MENPTTSFTGESDLYQQLLHRYGKSVAPHHRHLCETATAIHSTIISESLPFTPLSYFTTIIDALSDTSKSTHYADGVWALSTLLAIVLPLVPEKSITMSKAAEAAEIVAQVVNNPCKGQDSSRVLIECLGVLLEFCDSDDWESVQLGFQTLMKYSIHKRPKVRKCAQDCLVKVFKSFQSSLVKKGASKSVIKSLKTYMSLAVETIGSRSTDGSNDDEVSKCEHLEVLHMLDLLKFLIPYLPIKFISQAIVELQKCLSAKFSPLTWHVLDVMEEIRRFFESESRYTAADTLRIPNKWISCYSLVIVSIAGLLTSEATATRASNILKEMIERVSIFNDDDDDESESRIVESLCDSLLEVLNTEKGIPSAHSLAVISRLFKDLGTDSQTFMVNIFLKLASFMTIASGDVKHLRECIGAGVRVIRGEKVLSLIPIAFDANNLTCSNTWLIPIVKEHTYASSLGFFMDNIVPLAESLQEACKKVEKQSVIRQQLHSYARGCWGLLPALCRRPDDMDDSFDDLAKHLISCIKKDAFMLEDIAIALQHLVKQNTNKSFLDDDEASENYYNDWYIKEFGPRNIKALSSWSEELLKAFTKVLFKVSPEKRAFVKDTIGCLALITESSAVKAIFISSLKKRKLNVSVYEVASAFVGTAGTDPTDSIYDFIKEFFQEEDDNIQNEAYATLYKILESSEFRSSKFKQLMDLLLDLKSPVDITSLTQRFLCFKTLLVHSIEITCDRENTYGFRMLTCDRENPYGFRMLNEIIVTLKDSKKGRRKVAKDILLETSSILQKTSSSSKTGPYYKFITMIKRHLSVSSPCIKSGAVSALSLLISNDSKSCHLIPDLVLEVVEFLYGEDIQAIKAVLGFLKVLVKSLQVIDLQCFLSDILGALLPYSSVSEHRFKSKVAVILEIMMRKCGSASVISIVPERYQDFVNNVLDNPQGKAGSAEDVTDTTPNSGPKRSPNEEYSRQTGKRNKFDKHSGGGSKRKNTNFTKSDGSGGSKQKQL